MHSHDEVAYLSVFACGAQCDVERNSAVLLTCGYMAIRARKIAVHKAFMIAAFLTSTAFLISYLAYHYRVGHVAFQGQGWIRPVYFTLLLTHTVLAIVIVPMIIDYAAPRVAREVRQASTDRALDIAAVAVRERNRRDRLPDGVSDLSRAIDDKPTNKNALL